ncbi:hypothetical protein ACS0TY_006091 [Phlomoides rotata]
MEEISQLIRLQTEFIDPADNLHRSGEFIVIWLSKRRRLGDGRHRRYTILDRITAQMRNLHDLVMVSDDDSKDQLRMDRASFHKLCGMVKTIGGLKSSQNVSVEEKVAMFLTILAHHTKNSCVKFQFKRSGQTVSKHFHHVLNCILRLQYMFLAQAQLLPGTDIVANPHINSKIHVWKKEYGVLSDLLSKTGMGWNSTTSMIEVGDEEVWDASRLELMRVDLEQEGETGEKNVPRFKDVLNEVDDNSICKPYEFGKRDGYKGKKRKNGDVDLSSLVDSLGEFIKFSKEVMTREAEGKNKMDVEKESVIKNEQSKLIESLKSINGLKVSDKLKVCDELVQNPMRLELFLSLPTDEHEEYVWMLLDGRL